MKIEIWSDIVCPFCYLGKRHLEIALDQLRDLGEVHIEYRAFELNPDKEKWIGGSVEEELIEKYGMSLEEVRGQLKSLEESGKAVGLEYNFSAQKSTNTFDAHRLIKYAKDQGKEKEMLDRIYLAYFKEGRLVSDIDTLVELAQEVGLEEEAVRDVLMKIDAYASDVREDEWKASHYGINVVPFFVIDDKYAFSGAVPVENMVDILMKINKETKLESK